MITYGLCVSKMNLRRQLSWFMTAAIFIASSQSLAEGEAQTAKAQDDAPAKATTVEASSLSSGPSDITSTTAGGLSAAGSSTIARPRALETTVTRKIKGEFYSRNDIPSDTLLKGEGKVSAENYFGVKYSLTETQSIGVRQLVNFSYPTSSDQAQTNMGDTYFNYVNTKLLALGDKGSVTGIARMYFPTGESARFVTKNQGGVLGWAIASYPVGKFDLKYHLIGKWYNQSQDGYMADGSLKANADYYVEQVAEVVWRISEDVELSQTLGTANMWYRGIPDAGVTREHAYTAITELGWSPVKSLTVAAGLSNEVNIWDPQDNFQVYRSPEMTYYLLLAGSI